MDTPTNDNASSHLTTSINPKASLIENITGRRPVIPVAFALAIAFFFFTFSELKCGGQKFASVTGFNLVTGTQVKATDMMGNMTENNEPGKDDKIPANLWAILAFGTAIAGLGISLLKPKNEAALGSVAGLVGLLSLMMLHVTFKNSVREKGQGMIEADFQFPFWGAVIALGVASIVSYLRMRSTKVSAIATVVNNTGSNVTEGEPGPQHTSTSQPLLKIPSQIAGIDFKTMNKQRKYVLVAAAIGIIAMFLPWIKLSIFGLSQSANGMHGKGIIVFLCFIVSGLLAFFGDQAKNMVKTSWFITLLCGALSTVLLLWFYSDASGGYGGSFLSFGFYIAALASIGVIITAWLFKAPGDTIKDGFDSLKNNFGQKIEQ